LAAARQGRELAEGRLLPVGDGPQEHRYHRASAGLVAFERALHLDAIRFVGGDVIGAHEQKHDAGLLKVLVDLLAHGLAALDHAAVPAANQAPRFEQA
jgi:hypothetical protein